ncbi:hypothetical protein TNCV_4820891 [Trichonephila clavipes]|nr:hypothetical protein TNCV_4820891 [Trichonephila clavipes]
MLLCRGSGPQEVLVIGDFDDTCCAIMENIQDLSSKSKQIKTVSGVKCRSCAGRHDRDVHKSTNENANDNLIQILAATLCCGIGIGSLIAVMCQTTQKISETNICNRNACRIKERRSGMQIELY